MVLILESGLTDQITVVQVSGTPLDPGTLPLDRNPLGKIPALERAEGMAIYDSRVICRYLDNLAGAGMYPAARLYETLTLEATADGILEAALLMVYENRVRPEAFRFQDWVEGQWAKINRALDAIEQDWTGHLAGPLDMAHVAVGCALGYLDFRLTARDWRQGRPKLAAWEAGFARRPSMQETRPPAA
jgi:glutathione S-transferase